MLYSEIVALGSEERKDRCETCRLMLRRLAGISLCFQFRVCRDFLRLKSCTPVEYR